MTRILGIDTSNYTTSVAVVENGNLVYDARKVLDVEMGKRGLRQSEALFQHINNLPGLLDDIHVRMIDGICVSTRPRPVEGSYMPVFKAGENIAESIANILGVKAFKTSHQEGHIESAAHSIGFDYKKFVAIHISGGTTEILKVENYDSYNIEIIGGTRDISIGQFIDRIGVAMGMPFPAGNSLDNLAAKNHGTDLRIPSTVDGLFMNFSGQETQCQRYIEKGIDKGQIAFSVMLCVAKTIEKILLNLFREHDLPVLMMGGVSSSSFLKQYFAEKFNNNLYFSQNRYASDNAVGTAFIGYKKQLVD